MKLFRSPKGFTLIELLVVISIIAILASLAVPAVMNAMTRGQLVVAMNNARQIHLATIQAALDATATADSAIGWPGSIVAGTSGGVSTATGFVRMLVDNGYFAPADLKVFAAPGIPAWSGTDGALTGFTASNIAFFIYNVTDAHPGTAPFLTTKNFDAINPPDQTTFTSSTTQPFGGKGLVICRKAGDVNYYRTPASGTRSFTVPTGLTKLTDN